MSEPTPRTPDSRIADRPADDALAALNDHLARFFQHADTLLRDWQTYGDKLRRSIDGEVGQLGDKVAQAVADVGRNAASQLDNRVEQGVADSLASLRRELDSLARLASQTGSRGQLSGQQGSSVTADAPAKTWTSPIFWALVVANIMLAVLITASVRDCQARSELRPGATTLQSAPTPPGDPNSDPASAIAPDAAHVPETAGEKDATSGDAGSSGPTAPRSAPELLRADEADKHCETLASGYDAAAAEILLGAAIAATCGERSEAVENVLFERLAGDTAGDKPTGSPPKPESKPSGKKSAKKRSKKEPEKERGESSGKSSEKSGSKSTDSKSKGQ